MNVMKSLLRWCESSCLVLHHDVADRRPQCEVAAASGLHPALLSKANALEVEPVTFYLQFALNLLV